MIAVLNSRLENGEAFVNLFCFGKYKPPIQLTNIFDVAQRKDYDFKLLSSVDLS